MSTDSARPGRRPVDIDLLADVLAGVGSESDAALVAGLVATDPSWAAARGALLAAAARVSAALSDLATRPVPMPVDLANRIESRLRAPDGDDTPAESNVVPLDDARRERAGRKRSGGIASRDWFKVAVAASVIAVVALGADLVHVSTGRHSDKAASSLVEPNRLPQADNGPAVGTPGPTLLATGTDYSAATLGAAPSASTQTPSPQAPSTVPDPHPNRTSSGLVIGNDLSRLRDPGALAQCLSVVVAAHGGVPIRVDYALFDHQPALVVTLGNVNEVVAVGPRCGLDGVGAEELASTPSR